MARIGEQHAPGCGAVGKCSVPMWQAESPSGFCDRPAYGEQYSQDSKYAPPHWSQRDRNGHYINPHLAPPYAPAFCCAAHGGPSEGSIRFVRDGSMWCAFMPGFENLQENPAGFGATQDEADADLIAEMLKQSLT